MGSERVKEKRKLISVEGFGGGSGEEGVGEESEGGGRQGKGFRMRKYSDGE